VTPRMRRTSGILATLLVAATAAAGPALAADGGAPGPEIGARTGYGFSAGHLGAPANGNDNNLGDYVGGQWPIWIDAGYRVTGDLYLGGYLQYGVGFVNDDQQNACRNANVSCSASDFRIGIMARYRLPQVWQLSPWAGYGFGYEWGSFSLDQTVLGNTSTDSGWSGFELANLQLGADYQLSPRFALAPFVSVSFGEFRTTSTSTTNGTTTTTNDQDLVRRSFHEWILIGVRVAFTP